MKKILSIVIILFITTISAFCVKANSDDSEYVINRNRINESKIMVGDLY